MVVVPEAAVVVDVCLVFSRPFFRKTVVSENDTRWVNPVYFTLASGVGGGVYAMPH